MYGPDHAQVAITLGGLGNVERQLGELSAAKIHQHRLLEIFEAAYGPDHPRIAVALGNLGSVERQLGELSAAKAHQLRALEINEEVYGPDHPDTEWANALIRQPDEPVTKSID